MESVSVVALVRVHINTHDGFTKVTAKDDSFQHTLKANAPLHPLVLTFVE